MSRIIRPLEGRRLERTGHNQIWMLAKPGFIVVAALALFTGCGHKREANLDTAQSLPAVAVRARNVESKGWPSTEEVVGTVRARMRATMEAKVTGRIAQMPVVLGQRVTKGQLLGRVDAAEIDARLEQAQASLQQAERDWKRTSSLFEQQAVTRADYDAVNSRYLVAKGALAEAQAMVAYVEVRSPFDGAVTRKWVDVGDLAAPGKPLVDIEDPSALQLEADVPEAIASRIQPKASMAIRVDALTNELTGIVAEIAPAADPTTRTFRVKLDLPNNPALMSGQFARLLVSKGESNSLGVPASAVLQRGQMELVFVVENQHARLHLVKTGRHVGDEIEILSGLEAGDSVVVEGASQLSDGQPVQ
jgi:RND family efflux transporter MFP subunit